MKGRYDNEETGLTLKDVKLRGLITFVIDDMDEYTFLYTCSDYDGCIHECSEGDLEWIDRDKILKLPIWEGDKIMFDLLNTRSDVFSLKLTYVHDVLTGAAVDGKALMLYLSDLI